MMAALLKLLSSARCFQIAFILLLAVTTLPKEEAMKLQVNLQVNGSTSLPDPATVNAFLQSNSSLANPLLPNKAPVQLQLCNASTIANAFQYYTLQHPGGCEKAPELVKKSNKAVKTLELVWLVWAPLAFALYLFALIGICCKSPWGLWAINALVGFPKQLEAHFGGHAPRDLLKYYTLTLLVLIAGLAYFSPLWFLAPPPSLGQTPLHSAALPDPASLNPFLYSSGQNVTLHLCTVRDAFQIYVGFSDSCNQTGDFLYPGVSLTKDNNHALRHGEWMSALLFVAAWISFSSWACILAGLICHSAGILYRICFYRHKVYSIEMQVPAGPAA